MEQVVTADGHPGVALLEEGNEPLQFEKDQDIVDDDNDSHISTADENQQLKTRVVELERKVDTLESELRLIRRKVRAMDTSKYGYEMISEAVLRVLNDNSWNISRNNAAMDPLGRSG